uniref:DUF5615 domain-containing protein n=1 Tax=Candidatus Kentrum sp. UNK TaxID=2126344 RepID=A0A451B4S4_9GAMM|nr:MAG: hypothetical protein BECKUNK1418G_GA0071005_11983 [Candidatus Kentron sp. UNK]VFK73266.1 MAG: hypothetical protein BECKUNK1418H_GA0071006_11813 [Candidatus Kentron sp. UNK]
MKMPFDENISFELVDLIAREFLESNHIDLIRMRGSTDRSIWEYAKAENRTGRIFAENRCPWRR